MDCVIAISVDFEELLKMRAMPCVITMLDEVNFLLLFKWVVLYDGSLHRYTENA